MDNQNRNSEKKVTLEDLLKLKKAEKPDDIFWESFDKQLKEKTLQTLVCKPSLSSRISHISHAVLAHLKPAIPVGALALLTIGLFTYSQRPTHLQFSQPPQVAVANPSLSTSDTSFANFSSAKKHFVKNNIATDAHDARHYANKLVDPLASSSGVRYLAGSISSSSLATAITSNTLF